MSNRIGREGTVGAQQVHTPVHAPFQHAANGRSIHETSRNAENVHCAHVGVHPILNEQHAQRLHLREPGLYTSRWAPRNLSGGHQPLDVNQVWTKVCFMVYY
jgi:hypothetical protein